MVDSRIRPGSVFEQHSRQFKTPCRVGRERQGDMPPRAVNGGELVVITSGFPPREWEGCSIVVAEIAHSILEIRFRNVVIQLRSGRHRKREVVS